MSGNPPELRYVTKSRRIGQCGLWRVNITVTTAGYSVSYSPDIERPLKNRRTLDGRFPTVEEAKAAAERDRRKLKVA